VSNEGNSGVSAGSLLGPIAGEGSCEFGLFDKPAATHGWQICGSIDPLRTPCPQRASVSPPPVLHRRISRFSLTRTFSGNKLGTKFRRLRRDSARQTERSFLNRQAPHGAHVLYNVQDCEENRSGFRPLHSSPTRLMQVETSHFSKQEDARHVRRKQICHPSFV
jgi:hypothetical protein